MKDPNQNSPYNSNDHLWQTNELVTNNGETVTVSGLSRQGFDVIQKIELEIQNQKDKQC